MLMKIEGVHPEFANTSLCNSVSHSRLHGNPQILSFYIDSHLRGNDTDICKSGMLPIETPLSAYEFRMVTDAKTLTYFRVVSKLTHQ
jgi:hypothetical protein